LQSANRNRSEKEKYSNQPPHKTAIFKAQISKRMRGGRTKTGKACRLQEEATPHPHRGGEEKKEIQQSRNLWSQGKEGWRREGGVLVTRHGKKAVAGEREKILQLKKGIAPKA